MYLISGLGRGSLLDKANINYMYIMMHHPKLERGMPSLQVIEHETSKTTLTDFVCTWDIKQAKIHKEDNANSTTAISGCLRRHYHASDVCVATI